MCTFRNQAILSYPRNILRIFFMPFRDLGGIRAWPGDRARNLEPDGWIFAAFRAARVQIRRNPCFGEVQGRLSGGMGGRNVSGPPRAQVSGP